MLLGCIADDLTGATDLAIMLTRAGMRTLQIMEVPGPATDLEGYDAVVVALKTRTCPVREAVELSLASADALLARGARQLFFKYCSTFDSTDQGNIGPVADALLDRVGGGLALVCPAFPTNKRTIYMGNLFVSEVPLAESPMKDHPLTPMRDSNLVRVLQRQTTSKVGMIPFPIVAQGPQAIEAAFEAAQARGERYTIVDAITDADLLAIGKAAAGHKLITGGSGVALGLPANYIAAGLMRAAPAPTSMSAPRGRAAIIAGSCSEATRGQVAAAQAAGIPTRAIDPLELKAGRVTAATLAAWMVEQPADKPALVYSSAAPDDVRRAQDALGRDAAGAFVEQTMAQIAHQLVAKGFTRLIVAGGETSGAVVGALGVKALEIGPEIDPGVPWTRAVGHDLVLALKSGNFGAPDFFVKAWRTLT
jgi:3-dehydrotetronate 4-kinase